MPSILSDFRIIGAGLFVSDSFCEWKGGKEFADMHNWNCRVPLYKQAPFYHIQIFGIQSTLFPLWKIHTFWMLAWWWDIACVWALTQYSGRYSTFLSMTFTPYRHALDELHCIFSVPSDSSSTFPTAHATKPAHRALCLKQQLAGAVHGRKIENGSSLALSYTYETIHMWSRKSPCRAWVCRDTSKVCLLALTGCLVMWAISRMWSWILMTPFCTRHQSL